MAATRLSDNQKTELVSGFRAGESTQALANRFDCSANTVIRVVKTVLGTVAYEELKRQRGRGGSEAAQAELLVIIADPVVSDGAEDGAADLPETTAHADAGPGTEIVEAAPHRDEAAPESAVPEGATPEEAAPADHENELRPDVIQSNWIRDESIDSPIENNLEVGDSEADEPVDELAGGGLIDDEKADPGSPIRVAEISAEASGELGVEDETLIEAEAGIDDEADIDDDSEYGEDDDDDLIDDGDDAIADDEFGSDLSGDDDQINFLPIAVVGLGVDNHGTPAALRPLASAQLPASVYMLVDKTVELQARPLSEIAELGQLPPDEHDRQALVVFANPRQAKRLCGRTQRVIKLPDVRVIERTAPYLLAQGISRVVIEGALYSLPGS